MNLSQAVQDLFTNIRDVAQTVAPIAAVIGFIGLGIFYMGSSWPIVGMETRQSQSREPGHHRAPVRNLRIQRYRPDQLQLDCRPRARGVN